MSRNSWRSQPVRLRADATVGAAVTVRTAPKLPARLPAAAVATATDSTTADTAPSVAAEYATRAASRGVPSAPEAGWSSAHEAGTQTIEYCRAQSSDFGGFYGPIVPDGGSNSMVGVPDGSTGICYERSDNRQIAFLRIDTRPNLLATLVTGTCPAGASAIVSFCFCFPMSPSPPPPSPPPPAPPTPPMSPPLPPLQQCTHPQQIEAGGSYPAWEVTRQWCHDQIGIGYAAAPGTSTWGQWWDNGATFATTDPGLCILDYVPPEGAFVWDRYREHDARRARTSAQPGVIFVAASTLQAYAYDGTVAGGALLFFDQVFYCVPPNMQDFGAAGSTVQYKCLCPFMPPSAPPNPPPTPPPSPPPPLPPPSPPPPSRLRRWDASRARRALAGQQCRLARRSRRRRGS